MLEELSRDLPEATLLIVNRIVQDAELQADIIVMQAREESAQQLERAMARRAMACRFLLELRDAVVTQLDAEDETIAHVRGQLRARVLDRFDELQRELGSQGEWKGNTRPALRADSFWTKSAEATGGPAPWNWSLGPDPDPWKPPVPGTGRTAERLPVLYGSAGGLGLGFSPNIVRRPKPSLFGPVPTRPPRPVPSPSQTTVLKAAGQRRISSRIQKAALARNAGVFILLFCIYQIWGTSFMQARAQARLKSSFAEASALAAAHATSSTLPPANALSTPAQPPSTPDPPAPVAPPTVAGAVGLLRIPSIDLEQAIVEGVGVDDLRKAPGHYPGSAPVGSRGNVAVAGHRTTYGAPFRRLDELEAGDPIMLTTARGVIRYTVSQKPFVVSPTERQLLGDFGDDRLTLTTCHPLYQASKRLIVVARLAPPEQASATSASPQPSPAPAASAPSPAGPREVAPAEGPRGGQTSDLSLSGSGTVASVLGWTGLLAWLCVGFGWAKRRNRLGAIAVAVPLAVIVLLGLFEALNRLLPAGV